MSGIGKGGVASRLLAVLCLAAAADAAELPGVWSEFENGGWHTAAKEDGSASSGRRVSWFDQRGRAVFVVFNLPVAMPRAILFIRYSRAFGGDSYAELSFGPMADKTPPPTLAKLGYIRMPNTGGWEHYRWLSIPLGDLPAGRYGLIVRVDEAQGAGDLDVAVVAPDDPESRWMPPSRFENGRPVGEGEHLDWARPDDRLTEAELAAMRAEKERREAVRRAAAEQRAHISAPNNRLKIAVAWFGNDIETGPDIPAWGGQTPHNVADIHVTADGTLFTNVHWDEHGANVTEFKGGRWVNSAHVGNHGGGHAITANSRFIYFAGNRYRTGKQGIDRRTRENISCQEWNLHVDCGTVYGLAADEERVFAAVPEEDRIKAFDADLKPVAEWSAPKAGKLALDPQGRLWAILTADRVIARYTRDGESLPQKIVFEGETQPSDIAFDAKGRLYVADSGPSEQMLIYEDADTLSWLAIQVEKNYGLYV